MSSKTQPQDSPKTDRPSFLVTRMIGTTVDSPTGVVDLYPVVQKIDEPNSSYSSSCCDFSSSLYDSWGEIFPTSRDVEDSPRERPEPPSRASLQALQELPPLPDISTTTYISPPILQRNTSHESKQSRRSDRTAEESRSTESSGNRFQDTYVLTRQIFQCERSSVWECVHRVTGQRYCAKLCSSSSEVSMFRSAQGHSNIVRLHETLPTSRMRQYVVMEYVGGGNLVSAVVHKERLTEEKIRKVARQLLQALHHLHTVAHMTHNDVCPDNVLLEQDQGDTDWVVKLADFGAARRSQSSRSSALPGAWYRAPERTPSPAADMWSIGALILFCWHGNSEFSIDSPHDGLSRTCKQFLTQILSPDPEVRFTAQEALEHEWLGGTRQTPAVIVRGPSRWRKLFRCLAIRQDQQSSGETSTLDSNGGFS